MLRLSSSRLLPKIRHLPIISILCTFDFLPLLLIILLSVFFHLVRPTLTWSTDFIWLAREHSSFYNLSLRVPLVFGPLESTLILYNNIHHFGPLSNLFGFALSLSLSARIQQCYDFQYRYTHTFLRISLSKVFAH